MEQNRHCGRVHPFQHAIHIGRVTQARPASDLRRGSLVHGNAFRTSRRNRDTGDVLRVTADAPAFPEKRDVCLLQQGHTLRDGCAGIAIRRSNRDRLSFHNLDARRRFADRGQNRRMLEFSGPVQRRFVRLRFHVRSRMLRQQHLDDLLIGMIGGDGQHEGSHSTDVSRVDVGSGVQEKSHGFRAAGRDRHQ